MSINDLGAHPAEMTNDEYRALNGITSTELRRFMRAPVTLDYNPVQKSSDARTIGLAAHMIFSQDPRFIDTFQMSAFEDGRLKGAKAEKKQALEEGIEILKPALFNAATGAGEAARELLAKWTASVAPECDIVYEVPLVTVARCGLVIKSRPDAVVHTADGVWIVDLKTTNDASIRGFARQARSGGYITQLAHYCEVQATAHPDIPILGAVILAVETAEPFAGAPHYIDAEALTIERLHVAETYAEIYEARQTGHLPNIKPGTLYGDAEAVRAKHPDVLMRRALHLRASGLSLAKASKLAGVKIHKLRYALEKNPLNI